MSTVSSYSQELIRIFWHNGRLLLLMFSLYGSVSTGLYAGATRAIIL